jgi:hypothetical protein
MDLSLRRSLLRIMGMPWILMWNGLFSYLHDGAQRTFQIPAETTMSHCQSHLHGAAITATFIRANTECTVRCWPRKIVRANDSLLCSKSGAKFSQVAQADGTGTFEADIQETGRKSVFAFHTLPSDESPRVGRRLGARASN